MYLNELKDQIKSLEGFSQSKELRKIIDSIREVDSIMPPDYLFIGCNAVNGDITKVIPAAAAKLASFLSIHLVDDLLDEDVNGYHVDWGAGTSANMSQALLGAAFLLLNQYKDRPAVYFHLINSMADMIARTSFAQQDDMIDCKVENDYWKKIGSKTPPLFSYGLLSGTLIGCGELDTAYQVSKLGTPIGKLIQLSDDLADAFKENITPDWLRKTNNLAILFAMTAEHKHKEKFQSLIQHIKEPGILAELKSILFTSGAVSYCIYHLLELNKEIHDMIEQLNVPNKDSLHSLRKSLIDPARDMIETANQKMDKQAVRDMMCL